MKPGYRKLLPLALIGGGTPPEPSVIDMKAANIVLNKYIDNAGDVKTSDPNFYYSVPIECQPKDTFTLTCSQSLNYVSFMEYDGETFVKRTLYGGTGSSAAGKSITHTVGATTTAILWGSNPTGQKVTEGAVLGWKWKMTQKVNNLFDFANTHDGKFLSNSYGELSDANMRVVPTVNIPTGSYVLSFVSSGSARQNRRVVPFQENGSRNGAGTELTNDSTVGKTIEKTITLSDPNVMLKFSTSINDTHLCMVKGS